MYYIFNFVSKYKERYFSAFMVLLIDVSITFLTSILVAFILQLMLEFNIDPLFTTLWVFVGTLVSFFAFIFTKTYKIVIRHMSVIDMLPFLGAGFIKFLFETLFFTFVFTPVKPLIIIILAFGDCVCTFASLIAFRGLIVVTYDYFRFKAFMDKRLNVLIYDTNDKSVAIVNALQNSDKYLVIGFIKPKEKFDSHTIVGHNVYYYEDSNSISYLIKRRMLDAILFPNESLLLREKSRIVSDAISQGIKILVSPSIDVATNGVVLQNYVREIKIEDLLGRKEISVSMDVIKEYFYGKVVMVTGAAGSIGSQLCRQLAESGVKKLILFDNAETPMHYLRLELEYTFSDLDFVPVVGDVTNINRLDFVFDKYRPEVVFHAAAYKHVPLMEENPCEAIRVNVLGTRNVADKCIEYDVERMVMISTDKAVNPTNVMGCSKRIAEIYVQSLGTSIEKGEKDGKTRFVTTRFGNVLGSNGSVVPRFKEQIAMGGPVTVTHPDINRFFMTIPEACRLVMEAATLTTGNQIFAFDMGEPVKILDLARNMIRLAGLKPDVDIKIEFTGLRPGEKLYEEVLANEENTLPTTNNRIRIAQVRNCDYNVCLNYYSQLQTLSSNDQISELISLMHVIVPEYVCA